MILRVNINHFADSINSLVAIMVKDCVLCETLTELLCIICPTASYNSMLTKINNPGLEKKSTFAQNVHLCIHLKCIEEQISQHQKEEKYEYERFETSFNNRVDKI